METTILTIKNAHRAAVVRQIADKLICDHKMIEVVKEDNGIIWDFPLHILRRYVRS